jgi:hypothetical protein
VEREDQVATHWEKKNAKGGKAETNEPGFTTSQTPLIRVPPQGIRNEPE